MTRLNETFLRHKGSTDVITFDYAEQVDQASRLSSPRPQLALPGQARRLSCLLHGEIFVCLDEAVSQARRFHTTWQSELVRYVVHGVLHLLGYDDRDSRARRRMKAAEDALVRRWPASLPFAASADPDRKPHLTGSKPGTARISQVPWSKGPRLSLEVAPCLA